jgi:hypothetical protein
LGRGLGGVGNASDTPSTNGPLSEQKAMAAMPGMQHDMGNMQMGQMEQGDIAKNANDVPNFPPGRLHGRANDGDGRGC